jgi:hypothetical protein
MKHRLFIFYFIISAFSGFAQKDFIGIARYRMTVEGDSAKRTDSMAVIFGKNQIKIILFIPDENNWGIPREKIFIDDFNTQKTIDIDSDNGTFRSSPMKTDSSFEFINTNRYGACNRYLCLVYEPPARRSGHMNRNRMECLASIDFFKPSIKNYFFLGVQPIIIDNRIVMDYLVTQPDGLKPKVGLYRIEKMENTDKYFNLDGFTEEK